MRPSPFNLKTEMELNRRKQREQRLRQLWLKPSQAVSHPVGERLLLTNFFILCFLCLIPFNHRLF